MLGIKRRVNESLSARHGNTEVRLGETATNSENQVRLLEKVWNRRRESIATGAERQRMVLRERALSLQARCDWGANQLSEFFQRFPGARVMNSLPSINDEIFRFCQRGRGTADIGRIRAIARGNYGFIDERLWYILRK